jgi:CxxC motif-containing protein
MKQEILCIQCPVGCRMTADKDESGRITVSGNTCANGEAYAVSEMTDPKRTLTTIVNVEGGGEPVSVRSRQPVEKEKIFDCLAFLRTFVAPRGTKMGDVLVQDILRTGVDIIATRDDWNTN